MTSACADGVYTLEMAGHTVRVTDGGRTPAVDGSRFDLSTTRPTIVVEPDGTVHEERRGR